MGRGGASGDDADDFFSVFVTMGMNHQYN